MPIKKFSSRIDKGKVDRTYALILDFSEVELELLIEKLTRLQNHRRGNDPNRNKSTISL